MSRALRSTRPAAGFSEESDEKSSSGEGSAFDSLSGEEPEDLLDRCKHIKLISICAYRLQFILFLLFYSRFA